MLQRDMSVCNVVAVVVAGLLLVLLVEEMRRKPTPSRRRSADAFAFRASSEEENKMKYRATKPPLQTDGFDDLQGEKEATNAGVHAGSWNAQGVVEPPPGSMFSWEACDDDSTACLKAPDKESAFKAATTQSFRSAHMSSNGTKGLGINPVAALRARSKVSVSTGAIPFHSSSLREELLASASL
jgi:hypothetical protein